MPILGEITNTFSDALRDARVQLKQDRERTFRVLGEVKSINDEIKRREEETQKLRAEANALVSQTQAIRANAIELRREREVLPRDAKVMNKDDIDVDELRGDVRNVVQQVVPDIMVSAAPPPTAASHPRRASVHRYPVYGCRARVLAALVAFSIIGSSVWLLK
ncbi:hypothetical protein M407DRAFT_5327 [Tulasnella calospora MUT 4182]|uniref:Uncharacterized protein n=1 Tax=Tulasnella calospora MUT 4182 TaxID=1051891 RepID=A0A0C3LAI1_9AGAM|nr:hypothetical protein M407DRAFT_5327 [Tulasnella calospora MUT 4182]